MEACSNETATEEKQPNTQQGLKKARVNMTDEEYWKMKRAKNKERMKENKRKFETKVRIRHWVDCDEQRYWAFLWVFFTSFKLSLSIFG